MTGAASGEARKLISALAASGCRTALMSTPAKKVMGWSPARNRADEGNSGDMNQLADLLEANLRSPRATTAATGSPDGGPRTFRLLPAT